MSVAANLKLTLDTLQELLVLPENAGEVSSQLLTLQFVYLILLDAHHKLGCLVVGSQACEDLFGALVLLGCFVFSALHFEHVDLQFFLHALLHFAHQLLASGGAFASLGQLQLQAFVLSLSIIDLHLKFAKLARQINDVSVIRIAILEQMLKDLRVEPLLDPLVSQRLTLVKVQLGTLLVRMQALRVLHYAQIELPL